MSSKNSYLLIAVVVLGLIIVAGMFLLFFIPEPVAYTPSSATTTFSGTNAHADDTVFTGTFTTSTTSAAWEKAFLVVNGEDSGTTIHLKKNERFVVDLGLLKWSVVFTPSDVIRRIPNSPDTNGVQGIYVADTIGSTTMHAIGGPHCATGEACPQYLINVDVHFIVK